MWTELRDELAREVARAIQERFGVTHRPVVEVPPRRELGDFATPAPMQLARTLKRPPRAIAEDLAGALRPPRLVREVKVLGAGYLNLFLDRPAFAAALLALDGPRPAAPGDTGGDGGAGAAPAGVPGSCRARPVERQQGGGEGGTVEKEVEVAGAQHLDLAHQPRRPQGAREVLGDGARIALEGARQLHGGRGGEVTQLAARRYFHHRSMCHAEALLDGPRHLARQLVPELGPHRGEESTLWDYQALDHPLGDLLPGGPGEPV